MAKFSNFDSKYAGLNKYLNVLLRENFESKVTYSCNFNEGRAYNMNIF